MVIPVAVNIAIFLMFGLIYGFILCRAVLADVYRITGRRGLDASLLTWLLGIFAGLFFFPALYLGLSFHEFGTSPTGLKLTQQLRWAAWGQIAYVCLYGLLVLTTVRQQ